MTLWIKWMNSKAGMACTSFLLLPHFDHTVCIYSFKLIEFCHPQRLTSILIIIRIGIVVGWKIIHHYCRFHHHHHQVITHQMKNSSNIIFSQSWGEHHYSWSSSSLHSLYFPSMIIILHIPSYSSSSSSTSSFISLLYIFIFENNRKQSHPFNEAIRQYLDAFQMKFYVEREDVCSTKVMFQHHLRNSILLFCGKLQ